MSPWAIAYLIGVPVVGVAFRAHEIRTGSDSDDGAPVVVGLFWPLALAGAVLFGIVYVAIQLGEAVAQAVARPRAQKDAPKAAPKAGPLGPLLRWLFPKRGGHG